MDRNSFLAFALSFLVLSLWMAWEGERKPKTPPPEPVAEAPAAPETEVPAAAPAPPAPTAAPAPPAEPEVERRRLSHESELVRATFDSRGAGIERWELLAYRAPRAEGGHPVALIDSQEGEAPALASSFAELGLGDLSSAVFAASEEGPEAFAFEIRRQGVVVRKRFEFTDEPYELRLRLEVENGTNQPLQPDFDAVLTERARTGADFRDLGLAALVEGTVDRIPVAAFGRPGFFSSLFGGGPETERRFPAGVEWSGADSNYFLAAVVPEVARDAQGVWMAVRPGELAVARVARPASLLPGTSLAREYKVYLGPKEPARLEAMGAGLERSIRLGWTWIAPVTRAFLWLLDACYAVIPNYGVAIIILTALVRLVTAPLASRQMRSMRRLGEMQPRMKEIQDRYKNDREKQSEAMARLMKETGWNPLGGCLPMLLQIPVFIGLYYALQSSIALRQAPFALWIDDLSQPETLFTIPGLAIPVRLLPILMAISMVVQQKLTPASSMDPAQQRMMMIMMPLMFGFLFYTFPSGLVLYWFVSNLLAILQQLWMNRSMEPRKDPKKAAA
jgi:YidC/Oxa1 family membrane protein insertase